MPPADRPAVSTAIDRRTFAPALELAMFGSIGMPELIIILVIALIIFGPRKLPELGKSLGKSINEFKKASTELQNTLEQEIKLEEQKDEKARTATVQPPPTVLEPDGTLGQPVSRTEGGS